jgi:hypothetical protein
MEWHASAWPVTVTGDMQVAILLDAGAAADE